MENLSEEVQLLKRHLRKLKRQYNGIALQRALLMEASGMYTILTVVARLDRKLTMQICTMSF